MHRWKRRWKHLGQPLKKGTQKASRKPETVRGKTQMNPSGVVRIRFRSFPKTGGPKNKRKHVRREDILTGSSKKGYSALFPKNRDIRPNSGKSRRKSGREIRPRDVKTSADIELHSGKSAILFIRENNR